MSATGFRRDAIAKTAGRCYLCGSTDDVEAHHVIGLLEGGSNDGEANGLPYAGPVTQGLRPTRPRLVRHDCDAHAGQPDRERVFVATGFLEGAAHDVDPVAVLIVEREVRDLPGLGEAGHHELRQIIGLPLAKLALHARNGNIVPVHQNVDSLAHEAEQRIDGLDVIHAANPTLGCGAGIVSDLRAILYRRR